MHWCDRPVLVTADGPTYSNVPEDTDADRPVLVTADGPTYSNVPEDTGELSSDDEPLVNTAKASQQTGSCNSPEVVTVGDLFGNCISPETAIASDLTDPDWHEDTVQPSTSQDDSEPLICLTRKSRKRKNITFHRELETGPEVVTVGDLFGSCISPETAIASFGA